MGCNICNTNTNSDRPEMLGTHNWLDDLPDTSHESDIVEVRFKGTRKEFFRNESGLSLLRSFTLLLYLAYGFYQHYFRSSYQTRLITQCGKNDR